MSNPYDLLHRRVGDKQTSMRDVTRGGGVATRNQAPEGKGDIAAPGVEILKSEWPTIPPGTEVIYQKSNKMNKVTIVKVFEHNSTMYFEVKRLINNVEQSGTIKFESIEKLFRTNNVSQLNKPLPYAQQQQQPLPYAQQQPPPYAQPPMYPYPQQPMVSYNPWMQPGYPPPPIDNSSRNDSERIRQLEKKIEDMQQQLYKLNNDFAGLVVKLSSKAANR